ANGEQIFDPNDTVFYTLPEDYFKDTKEAMHEVDMKLRVTEHEDAINNDLNLLGFKCGFGTQFYRFERGNVTTATQVISENSDLYRSVCKHEIILEDVLKNLIRVIIRLGNAAKLGSFKEDADITIDFDDSIIEDSSAERNEDRQDVSIGAMGLDEYRAKWYGETIEKARENLPEQSAGVIF
ncbi:MAG: phage portal protein, partial [Actinomyces bouchesdurhonensis]|nr:phage portal protein [Actinomyces bouchesdurhonensis]